MNLLDEETGEKNRKHIFECYRSSHSRMNNRIEIGFLASFSGRLYFFFFLLLYVHENHSLNFSIHLVYFFLYTLFTLCTTVHIHYIRFIPLHFTTLKCLEMFVCMWVCVWFWFPLICHFIFLYFALYHFECRIGIIWREQNKRTIFSMPTQCHDRSLTFLESNHIKS